MSHDIDLDEVRSPAASGRFSSNMEGTRLIGSPGPSDLLLSPSMHSKLNNEKHSIKLLVTGLPGSGKRTWLRNIYLNNAHDKASACVQYSEEIHKYIVSSYNSVMKAAESMKLKGHRGSLGSPLHEGSSTDLGRFVPGMSRVYLKEMRAVGFLEHVAQYHFDTSGRISQPDYIPTVVDCLLLDSEHACDSDELTVVYDDVEYNFFVVEYDQLSTVSTKPYCDNLTLIVDVIDVSTLDDKDNVEKALNFYAALNRLPAVTNTENKFMTVPIVMLFNKFDILEKNFESKKLDLRSGFENFKGRKNMETIKEYIKAEFYAHTHGERDVFSCFKTSLSASNDIMASIAKAVHKVVKKREMSKILKLSTKMSTQRILSGEAHALLNLGNPDSHSEIPFDRLAWKDLLSLARALGPPLPSLNSLTCINLRNNNLGARGVQVLAEALTTSRTLTSLRLASNEILDEGARYLADMLDKNSSVLLELTLTNNFISDTGAEMLAAALCKNNSLTLIDLSENFIRDSGATNLVCALQANRKMRVLNLWGNRIQSFTIFDQLYRTNRTITELNFSMNAHIDSLEPAPNVHSLMRVTSLLADNYASGLTFLSFDAANPFFNAGAEFGPTTEEARTLRAQLERNQSRAERGGADIIDVAHSLSHYDYSNGAERIVDWGNYSLSHLDMPDLGWGAGVIAITELYLDNNAFREFPYPIIELRNLRTLVLGSNELTSISPDICLLTSLLRLDLSCNKISVLPASIGSLVSLKILDVRFNTFYSLVDDICQLVSLEWLLIQQNNLTTLPANIFQLTRLSSLEVQGNTIPPIKAMIYNAWVAKTTELDLSHADITVLPLEIGNLTLLTSLFLSDNALVSLPPVIGNLTDLKVLDVRNNKLESLPWQIGTLVRLDYLRLEGNTLSQIPNEVRSKDLPTLKQYLKSLATGEEESFRMKLMLVGAENVGKTTTSRILREEMAGGKKKVQPAAAPNISTDGIDILNWEYEEDGCPPITFGVWDFAGQEVYYSTHQFFLTTRSIYVIVFNMMASEETMRLEYWLQSVKFAAPTAPIVIIGTHADHSRCTPEFVEHLTTQLQRYFSRFRNVKGFFPVSCKTRRGFDAVRASIIGLARSQPASVTRFPRSYLTLEGLILSERRLRMPPVITFDMFSEMVIQCGAPADTSKTIASFLNELGTIIWVDDPRLSSMVILDPQWLAKLMATLITSKMNFVNNGILDRKNLHFVWKPPEFPESLHSNLVNLLEQFEILYRMPSAAYGAGEEADKYLLMCLVNDKRPPLEWPRPGIMAEDKPQAMRIYQLPFVPLGLMAKLMTRILYFVVPSIYWKDGMVAELDTNEILLEFLPLKNQIAIHLIETLGKNADLAPALRLLMENFDNLIEGYYRIKREIFLCCTHCLFQRNATPHLFSYETVEHAAATGQSMLYCEADANDKVAVHLSSLAPDLVLADLEHFRMDYKDLSDLQKLGEGAFGIVYKANYKNEEIAFKQLNMTGAVNPAELYAELRREVWLSSGLRHPNIVALKGMCFEPYGMAMEFIPHGNLYDWLRTEGTRGGKELGWEMRLRIAMDLASGMRFLHNATPKIIHRDFKSPNVLMSLTAEVACKVSDFGASRAVAKCFGRNDLGNPSWLAPEIMKGESYTEKADVFSYGMVLWELLTHEHPYAEYPISTDKFLSKFEQAIMAGLRPTIPSDCVPEFSVLINKCWDAEPSKRPSFDEVYFILCQIRRRLFPDFLPTEEEQAVTALMMRATANEMNQANASRTMRTPMRAESVLTNRKSATFATGFSLANIGVGGGVGGSASPSTISGNAVNNSNTNVLISTKPTPQQQQQQQQRDSTSNPYNINTNSSNSSSGTGTRGVRTHHHIKGKDLEGGSSGPLAPPVVRIDGGGAGGGAGSVDALIGQFYFAKQLDPRPSPVVCLCHVPLMREMWAGCQDGSISVYNVNNYQLVEDREGNHEAITCMVFDNKDAVWCGSSDSKIYIWDVKSGKRKKVLSKHKEAVTCLECSTNKFVVSGSVDQVIRIWDTKTFTIIKKVIANLGPITALTMQDEVLWVAAGQKVVTFSVKTLKILKSHDAHKDKINCMLFVNNQVWSCSQDTTILVWNSETQEVLDELEYPHMIQCLLPSRSGQCVYAGTANKSVVVWNTKTLKMVREQTRHDGAVLALAKGVENYIWSGSQDKTNCIWQEVDDPLSRTV